ncbi:hypothetical protein [Nitrosomonas sp. Nm132]|nr:hypothetical protein [Nitrosomonas sp. Nm132]
MGAYQFGADGVEASIKAQLPGHKAALGAGRAIAGWNEGARKVPT